MKKWKLKNRALKSLTFSFENPPIPLLESQIPEILHPQSQRNCNEHDRIQIFNLIENIISQHPLSTQRMTPAPAIPGFPFTLPFYNRLFLNSSYFIFKIPFIKPFGNFGANIGKQGIILCIVCHGFYLAHLFAFRQIMRFHQISYQLEYVSNS